jgi:hypothetical protein
MSRNELRAFARDLSINGEIVAAPFVEGRRELWTARLR